jgi:hypothetical protein
LGVLLRRPLPFFATEGRNKTQEETAKALFEFLCLKRSPFETQLYYLFATMNTPLFEG